MTDDFAAAIGASTHFSRTVAESDIYLFAGLTGDFSANHLDEQFMSKTAYGRRIAHGALLVGFMSRTSTMITDQCGRLSKICYPVSVGYDRIRFLKPVFIGDTITVNYTIIAATADTMRTSAEIQLKNHNDEVCAVATHIMKWFPISKA
jgi:3-hydroxybutyryl-CoA dehydratase